jgi:hypothetical protein
MDILEQGLVFSVDIWQEEGFFEIVYFAISSDCASSVDN